MGALFEGRASDSPYIHMIWRGRVLQDNFPTCPADVRWNLLLMRYQDRVKVTVEGPTTQIITKTQIEGYEFLVIKFRLGYFIPTFAPSKLVNGDVRLPEGAGQSFWLNSATWQYPDFENAETFVERLVREDILVSDTVVKAVLQDQTHDYSSRTIRRRFLSATGLAPKMIQQIERAHFAMSLLGQGVPILDTVHEAGYADQPHLTRSLKRYIGQTPAQVAIPTPVSSEEFAIKKG